MSRFVLAYAGSSLEHRIREAIASTRDDEVRRLGHLPDDARPGHILADLDETPEVVVLGPDAGVAAALQLAGQFDAERPEVSVVLAVDADMDVWAAALHAGVRDVVDPNASIDELRAALGRAAQTAAGRRRALASSADAPGAGEPAGGGVLVVASPKGGSGKTTVATNLATGLAAAANRGVVLVDLDLQFGDVASALGITPEHTLANIAGVVKSGDAMAVKTRLTAHPSGLYVMCAPEQPADADTVTAEHVTALIQLLASQFAHVVVDTAPGLSEHTLAALEQATDLLMVSSLDVPSVRGVYKEHQVLDQLGLTARRHLILNGPDPRGGLTVDDVQSTLGLAADVVLPRSRALSLSTNRGVPLLVDSPRAAGARELTELVARFAPQANRPTGLLARLKGSR